MNKLMIIGRMTKDVEIKTKGDVKFCYVSVAVDRAYQKKGEERKTDFIDAVAFGSSAELIKKYFPKGSRIGLTGYLQSSMQEKNGAKWNQHTMMIESVDFCESTGKKQEEKTTSNTNCEPDDEILPFDIN